MNQATLFADPVLNAARALGAAAADKCAAKAEAVAGFSVERAKEWVVNHLHKHGPTSGEELVDGMKSAEIRPHDDRAFGPVFTSLVRAGRIERYGFALRKKGHGTAGANIWRIVR